MEYLISIIVVFVVFLIVDAVWLGLVARSFYVKQLGDLLRDKPLKAPAGVFYFFYAIGLSIIAVQPLAPDISWQSSAAFGALIGFLSYGTYDMTNLSTIKGWPILMSFVDWTWGTLLSGTAAAIGRVAVTVVT